MALSYKDMTFCDNPHCRCDRKITDDIRAEAKRRNDADTRNISTTAEAMGNAWAKKQEETK